MSKLYLQNIIDGIPFENLPVKWRGFDFGRFSKDKTLFDFQKQGLQNALKGLWLYYSSFQNGWQSEGLNGYLNTPSYYPSVKGWTPKADGVVADTLLQEGNYEVEFEDGTKINTKDLDYKLIKPLIWWE